MQAIDIPGHMYPDECAFLSELARGHDVLEIGTHNGRSTAALALHAKSVTTIDNYLGDSQIGAPNEFQTRSNLASYANVVVHNLDWTKASIDYSFFSMIFYDGSHTQEKQFLEQLLTYPGIIALHDYKFWDEDKEHTVEAINWYAGKTHRAISLGKGSIAYFNSL